MAIMKTIKITVKSGETVRGIASKYLGDPAKFREVCELNDLTPLSTLEAGIEILISSTETEKRPNLILSNLLGRSSTLVEGIPPGYTQHTLDRVQEINS